ncbi:MULTISPECIES: FidL-like protein [unclassified Enterobacter]|uniref:FidL-like protein n=1 Tax=unclassified Enterobacter TaxID=2608935 RepID=UPI0023665915|nr:MULTISPECIES: FidL-like protein [unclassified Enterobacter]
MKTKYLTAVSIITIVILAVLIVDLALLGQKRKETLNDKCTAVFEIHDTATGFWTVINAVLVMNPNDTAYIDLSGTVEHKQQKFVLSRQISFTYDKEGEDIYRLTGLGLSKHAQDNAPDPLIDRLLFSLNNERERFMTIKRVKNAYVAGNLHSPVFMCVVK